MQRILLEFVNWKTTTHGTTPYLKINTFLLTQNWSNYYHVEACLLTQVNTHRLLYQNAFLFHRWTTVFWRYISWQGNSTHVDGGNNIRVILFHQASEKFEKLMRLNFSFANPVSRTISVNFDSFHICFLFLASQSDGRVRCSRKGRQSFQDLIIFSEIYGD